MDNIHRIALYFDRAKWYWAENEDILLLNCLVWKDHAAADPKYCGVMMYEHEKLLKYV